MVEWFLVKAEAMKSTEVMRMLKLKSYTEYSHESKKVLSEDGTGDSFESRTQRLN